MQGPSDTSVSRDIGLGCLDMKMLEEVPLPPFWALSHLESIWTEVRDPPTQVKTGISQRCLLDTAWQWENTCETPSTILSQRVSCYRGKSNELQTAKTLPQMTHPTKSTTCRAFWYLWCTYYWQCAVICYRKPFCADTISSGLQAWFAFGEKAVGRRGVAEVGV